MRKIIRSQIKVKKNQNVDLSISEGFAAPGTHFQFENPPDTENLKYPCNLCSTSYSSKSHFFVHFEKFHLGRLSSMNNDGDNSSETIGTVSNSPNEIISLESDNEKSESMQEDSPVPEDTYSSSKIPTELQMENSSSLQPFQANKPSSLFTVSSAPAAPMEVLPEVDVPFSDSDSCISNKAMNDVRLDENNNQDDTLKKYWCKFCDSYWQGLDKLKNHVRHQHNKDPKRITRWNYAIWDLEICQFSAIDFDM